MFNLHYYIHYAYGVHGRQKKWKTQSEDTKVTKTETLTEANEGSEGVRRSGFYATVRTLSLFDRLLRLLSLKVIDDAINYQISAEARSKAFVEVSK